MKKLLYLIAFIPLFCLGQERKVASYIDSVWTVNDSVVIGANAVYDSLGINFDVDSTRIENDSMIILIGHTIAKVQEIFFDLLFVRTQGDAMYTAVLSGNCATVCKSGDCTGCYKKSDCSGCGCNGYGVCLEGNYGVSFEGNMSNIIRANLILSIGNEIPEN